MKKHIISMLVEDEPGVMTRIAGLFARRCYNIENITVGKTHINKVSKVVITTFGDEKTVEQVEKQLKKLIDVKKISTLKEDESIVKELCMVKVSISDSKAKDDIIHYADVYKAPICDITSKSVVVELVGKPQKIDAFIELVKPYGVKDISRTGITAMSRGPN